jgi:hypothetical protein
LTAAEVKLSGSLDATSEETPDKLFSAAMVTSIVEQQKKSQKIHFSLDAPYPAVKWYIEAIIVALRLVELTSRYVGQRFRLKTKGFSSSFYAGQLSYFFVSRADECLVCSFQLDNIAEPMLFLLKARGQR